MSKDLVKIITYSPHECYDKLRYAIGVAGGGRIGKYAFCAFVSDGIGYFMPLEGANPYIGEKNKIENVYEKKIEFICEKDKVNNVIKAIKSVHPYEEVVIEIYELINHNFTF